MNDRDCTIRDIVRSIETLEWWTVDENGTPIEWSSTSDYMGDNNSEYECTWCGKFFEQDWDGVQEHVFQQYTTCNKCDEMTIPITEFGAPDLCSKCKH